MWDRVGEQVTRAIFRLERDSKQFVGNLWQLTEARAIHAAALGGHRPRPDHGGHVDAPAASGGGGRGERELSTNRGGGEPEAVVTIHNDGPAVGRNDPCPCGSGKKYKKCHGS